MGETDIVFGTLNGRNDGCTIFPRLLPATYHPLVKYSSSSGSEFASLGAQRDLNPGRLQPLDDHHGNVVGLRRVANKRAHRLFQRSKHFAGGRVALFQNDLL